jgi:diguanylate cyclase (GGDEF)-like protein/PAS domain S-box-containing protein
MAALSIRWRFLIVTWLMITMVSALFSVLLYTTQKREYLAGIDARLLTAATIARQMVGSDFHDRLTSVNDLSAAEYLAIVERNNTISRENGLQYLWSNLILANGEVVFTTATSTSHDAANGDHAGFFDVHSDPAAFAPALRAGRATWSGFENEWGEGRMLLLPFRDARGRTYLFGASISIAELEARQIATLWQTLKIFAAMLVASGVVVLVFGRLTVQPLQRLRRMTESIAMGNYGSVVRFDGGGEEIESLAASVNAMSQTIKHNIHEMEALLRRQRLFIEMFEHSGEAIMLTDAANRIIEVNPAFTRLTGYTLDEVKGEDPRLLASGKTQRETYQQMWASLLQEGHWQGELWDRNKSGAIYPKWASLSTIRDESGHISHFIASFTDISLRKAAEDRIAYLAHHDVLTGLPNRFSLEERLEQALVTARRSQGHIAVMFIDLDRFKVINDSLGHHIGDLLLVAVADRLRQTLRECDIVARIGGDEFVVVASGRDIMQFAAQLAKKLLLELGAPYLIDGHSLHTTPSIGISLYPSDGESADALMQCADTAMYHAKEQGRNNVQFFTSEMNRLVGEQLKLEQDLHLALTQGQMYLCYQPQFSSRSQNIVAVEALVRWQHPELGLIPPLRFISIAEESGQMVELGLWILDEACRQLAGWRAIGISHVRMAINISAQQLASSSFVDDVAQTLARYSLKGGDLELEITESVAMRDPTLAIRHLNALRNLGIMLAIDDFGTGYSSLAYLKLLPVHCLKLDRSFVHDIGTFENDGAISGATIALAHSLGLNVVAEGVETQQQSDFLSQQGCDLLQGFHFSRPERAERITELLQLNL